jgi:tetratricopeptide (TPR) repeat protein
MDAAKHSPSIDAWGEPSPEDMFPERAAPRIPGGRRVLVVVGLIILVAVAAFVVQRIVSRSLAASCAEARRAGDWGRLEHLAQRWRWWERGAALPLLYLAEAAHEAGRDDQASDFLGQLPDRDPRTPAALVERSTLLFGPLNRPLEGAETLERALALDPKLVMARQRLIYFYAFTLQRKKMVDHCHEAMHYDSDLPETYVYLVGQDWLSFANAYDENTKWLRSSPDEELFLVARAIYRISSQGLDVTEDPRVTGPRDETGNLRHEKLLATYRERFPQNLEVLAYLLERSRANGDMDAMAKLLTEAPAAAADDNRFWKYKGWLHATLGELAEAKECYEKALSLNCFDHVSRHQLAGVARRFQRMDDVQVLEETSRLGWALRREVLQLQSVDKVSPATLQRIAEYAKRCGDYSVAGKLLLRLENLKWSKGG